MARILKLEFENVKRLVAGEINPDGSLVIVAGKNRAGKTSALDSIEYALGGKGRLPREPLRRGAASGHVRLDIGDLNTELVVERVFTPDDSRLIVRGADGKQLKSPQAILDKLTGPFAFDPLEFRRMKPAEQVETLKKVLGLDFSSLEAERQRLYDDRTELNRLAKLAEGQIHGLARDEHAPAAEVSLGELSKKLQKAVERNGRIAALESALGEQEESIAAAEQEIIELERKLAQAKSALLGRQEKLLAAKKLLASYGEIIDTGDLKQQMDEAEAVNARVRQNQQYEELAERIIDLRAKADECSAVIQRLDERKAGEIAAAKFPVAGLGFGPEGVTVDGIEFSEINSETQIRVSVAIGLTLHPYFPVLLVRNGNDIDANQLSVLAKLADEAQAQVWLERIDTSGPVTVVIEEGRIAGAPENPAEDSPKNPIVAEHQKHLASLKPVASLADKPGAKVVFNPMEF